MNIMWITREPDRIFFSDEFSSWISLRFIKKWAKTVKSDKNLIWKFKKSNVYSSFVPGPGGGGHGGPGGHDGGHDSDGSGEYDRLGKKNHNLWLASESESITIFKDTRLIKFLVDIVSNNNYHRTNNFFKINLDQEVDPGLVQVIPVHMAPVNRSIKVDLDRADHKWVQVQAVQVQVDQWDLDQDNKWWIWCQVNSSFQILSPNNEILLIFWAFFEQKTLTRASFTVFSLKVFLGN